MIAVLDLWFPILLAAVLVFVASSVIHMALPIHRGDFQKLASEDAVLESMRNHGVQPGEYMFPCASSMKEMGSPEMLERLNQGPVGWMTVLPNGPIAMGKSLVGWFVFCLVIGVFVGYLGTFALEPGAAYGTVFRFTATVAVLGYAFSNVTNSMWKGSSWTVTAKYAFDGIVYALLTAGTFAWLWPEAA